MRSLARRLRQERGQALIEGLLALGLVLLVVAFAAQAIAYAHARSVAEAAAQDGARAAMHANASVTGNEVTITVNGEAPHLFNVPLVLPAVAASASLPLEQYPADEQVALP